MQAGISTNGATLSYGTGGNSKTGTKPENMTTLGRISAIGGISIEPETLDASTLEDKIERSIPGRASTGGNFSITVNITDETITEWQAVETAQAGLSSSSALWFQIILEGLTKSFWVIAAPPSPIPMPDVGQNEVATVEMTMTIVDYVGIDAKVTPAS